MDTKGENRRRYPSCIRKIKRICNKRNPFVLGQNNNDMQNDRKSRGEQNIEHAQRKKIIFFVEAFYAKRKKSQQKPH